MRVPLYGQADAGLCWYKTLDGFLTKDCGMTRDETEPCIYDRRVGLNGDEHVNMDLYVDDGKIYSDPTPAGRAEKERIKAMLSKRFDIKFQESNQSDTHLLSANIHRYDHNHTSISMQTYIEKAVRDHLPSPVIELIVGLIDRVARVHTFGSST